MNLSISSLLPSHPLSSRQRRRSNSSSNILTSTINVKAVRSPRRNESLNDTLDNNNSTGEYFEDNNNPSSNRTISRPPRLAFDTSSDNNYLRISMTPPSRQEYKAHHQNQQHMLLYNSTNSHYSDYHHHNSNLSGKESRTTSFSSTRSTQSTQSMNKSLTAFYNERIEKRTSMAFDDDDDDDDACSDSESDTTLSVSSSACDEDAQGSRRDSNHNNQLAKQVLLLRKEIEVVKNSLEGLQKDHKEMLNEKKQLEQQYQEAKYEVTKTLECSTNDLMEYNELLNAKMEKLSLELGVVPSRDSSDFSEDTGIINNNGEWSIEYANIMNNCVKQAKELEYLQAELEKSKQDFRLLLSFKEEIEKTLKEKEREYLEKIRECEAVANYQAGTINSMEKLLKELEIKMGKLLLEKNEQRQERLERHKHNSSVSSHLSATSILSNGEKLKKKHTQKASVDIKNVSSLNNSSSPNNSLNDNSTVSVEELIPSYCLSPPQSRRQSCTNPITLFTDEERIRHQTRFCLAKRWVEDDEVSICQQAGCSVKFNLWNRRHHCRRCGNIFCNPHSAYSMLLFTDGSEDWGGVWSRVCESCFKDSK